MWTRCRRVATPTAQLRWSRRQESRRTPQSPAPLLPTCSIVKNTTRKIEMTTPEYGTTVKVYFNQLSHVGPAFRHRDIDDRL